MRSLFFVLVTLAVAPAGATSTEAAPTLELRTDESLRPALLNALLVQMPGVEFAPAARAGTDDRVLSVVVLAGGAQVELDVSTPEGGRLMSRRLPMDAALVGTCALIVDRFLSETRWPGLTAPVSSRASTDAHWAPARAYSPPIVGLGARLTRGLDQDASSLGPELSLFLRGPRVAWGLRLAWLKGADRVIVSSDPLDGGQRRGTLVSSAGLVEGSVGLCLGGALHGCASAVLGAVGTWARASGVDVFRQRSHFGLQPVAGLALALSWERLPLDLHLEAELTGLLCGTTRFTIEGNGEALGTPRLELGLGLRLARSFR